MLLVLLAGGAALARTESVRLNYQIINGFPVKYVTVNLLDPEVVITPVPARTFPTGLESWSSFITRMQPDAAINGTYFCVNSFMPVGDVAVNGALLYRGVVGTALCITPDNRVLLRPGPHQQKPDWRGFRSVLCAGPRLLSSGRLDLNARAEGFRDPHVLGSAPRSAVAWRPDGSLMLLTIERNISLSNLAYVCQRLGATEALALDGGNSSGLYAEGRTVTKPGRSLSNILAVYSTPQRYARAAGLVVPERLPILARLVPDNPLVVASNATLPRAIQAPPPTPPAGAKGPTVRFLQPESSQIIEGTIQVTVEVDRDIRLAWMSLRINGQLRAMSNQLPFRYQWDSTKEEDGLHTIEVTAWSNERTMLGQQACKVFVRNAAQVSAEQ